MLPIKLSLVTTFASISVLLSNLPQGLAFQCLPSAATHRNHRNQIPSGHSLSASRVVGNDDFNETRDIPVQDGLVSVSIVGDRRSFAKQALTGGMAMGLLGVKPVHALVEGNPPPSKTTKKSLPEEYRQGTAALADTEEAAVIPREAYKKLPSGVIYADINAGNGEEVKEGSRVNMQWVLRRSNGYFVDSSAVSDSVFIFTVGSPNGAIEGLDEGVRGMKSGGTRRILIPPRLAYVTGIDDGKPGPIPAGFGPRQQMRRVMEVRKDVPGEYIFLEVKVTRVR